MVKIFDILLEELNKPLREGKEEIELREKQWEIITGSSRKTRIFDSLLPDSKFAKSKSWMIILESWRSIPCEIWHRTYECFCRLLISLDHHVTIDFMQNFCPPNSKDHEFFIGLQIYLQKHTLLQQETFFSSDRI